MTTTRQKTCNALISALAATALFSPGVAAGDTLLGDAQAARQQLLDIKALAMDALTEDVTVTRARAFGDPSGDRLVPGLGLLIEILDGDSDEPVLRMSGGMPGHEAVILVADEPSHELDEYGTWQLGTQDGVGPWQIGDGGATWLVDQDASILASGSFDWRGTFQMPWPEQPAGTQVWVQGMESGGYFAVGSKSVQMSHALRVSRGDPQADHDNLPLLLAPLPPLQVFEGAKRLVDVALDIDELADVTVPRLDAVLAQVLERDGDSIALTIKVKASGMYSGITIGAGLGGSFKVTRTSGDRFIVRYEGSQTVGAGIKGNENLSLTAVGEYKLGKDFRFHSVQGLGRGLRALMLGDSTSFQKTPAIEFINGLVDAKNAAADELGELGPALDKARDQVKALAKKVKTKVGKTVFGPALKAAEKVVAKLESKRDKAVAALEQASQELAPYADEVRTLALIAQTMAQAPMFLQDHLFAMDMDFGQYGKLDLGLPMAVETATAGASLTIQGSKIPWLGMRVERMSEPQGLAITRTITFTGKAQGMVGTGHHGVEATAVPSLQFITRFELPAGEAYQAALMQDLGELIAAVTDELTFETRTEIGFDMALAFRKGTIGYAERGVGRSWKIATGNEHSIGEHVDAVVSFLDTGDVQQLLAPLGSRTVSYSLQSRRVQGVGAKIAGDMGVVSGGLDEASALWTDPGRKFEVELSVEEAIGITQVLVQAAVDELADESGETDG